MKSIIAPMYIVIIGWLYIIALMALTEGSVVAGLLTLVFYGIAPVALFLWIFGTPARRRAEARKRLPQQQSQQRDSVVVGDLLSDVDRGDAKPDQ